MLLLWRGLGRRFGAGEDIPLVPEGLLEVRSDSQSELVARQGAVFVGIEVPWNKEGWWWDAQLKKARACLAVKDTQNNNRYCRRTPDPAKADAFARQKIEKVVIFTAFEVILRV